MMEAEIFILFLAFIPGLYFLYLYYVDPWSREKKRRKLHEYGGDVWISTEGGGMGIDTENWVVYIYKWDE